MPEKKHLVSNLLGRISSVALNLATMPVYLSILGSEAIGLLGLYAAITTLFSLLDIGLPTTANRILAGLSADTKDSSSTATAMRTFELPFWAVSIGIVCFAGPLAKLIATSWLGPSSHEPEILERLLTTLVVLSGIRFSLSFYQSALYGLHEQVLANVIIVASAVLRFGLPLAVHLFTPIDFQAFIAMQAIIICFELFYSAHSCWQRVGGAFWAVKPNKALFNKNLSFSIGVTGISISAALLSQVDKVVLSKSLTLSAFGYYTIAYSLSSGIVSLAYPVANAAFPHLSKHCFRDEYSSAIASFSFFFRCLVLLILPISFVSFFFAEEIIGLYLGARASEDVFLPFKWMALGAVFACLVALIHVFLLALGLWKQPFLANIIALPIFSAAVFFFSKFGVEAVGVVIFFHHALYFAFLVGLAVKARPLVFRTLIMNECRLLVFPVSACVVLGIALEIFFNMDHNIETLFGIITVYLCVLLLFVGGSQEYRGQIRNFLGSQKSNV